MKTFIIASFILFGIAGKAQGDFNSHQVFKEDFIPQLVSVLTLIAIIGLPIWAIYRIFTKKSVTPIVAPPIDKLGSNTGKRKRLVFPKLKSNKKWRSTTRRFFIISGIAAGFLILFFLITNPNTDSFKKELPGLASLSKVEMDHFVTVGRIDNRFLYSLFRVTYKMGVTTKWTEDYYGVIGNFYKINHKDFKVEDKQ